MSRKLVVEILGDTSGLERSTRRARRDIDGLGGSVGKLRVGFGTLAKSVGIVEAIDAAIRGMTASVRASIDEFSDQQKVAAQTNAVLASTASIANVSAQHVDDLAASLSSLSGVDDEVIQSGENLLLTFTSIRNFAGKNNDIFDQTTQLMLDVSKAMGITAPKAALQLGKALNDPARGVARLQRIGVAFTASQKEQIASLVASGKTMEAQKVILAELTREFGGSAKAAGETLPGQLSKLRETLRNVGGEVVGYVAPAFESGVRSLNRFAASLQDAQGARAKLRVVFEGARAIAERVFDVIREGVKSGIELARSIDWRAEAAPVVDALREGVRVALARLRQVDWGAEIDRAARTLGDALVSALEGLRHAIDRVDWNQVGRYITIGIGVALGAVGRFLARLPWAKIADQIGRLFVAALRAARGLFWGIADTLETGLENALGAALDALGRWLEKKSLEIALKIIEPFSKLPYKLGDPFRALKTSMQEKLDELTQTSSKGGADAASAYVEGFHHGIEKEPGLPSTTTRRGATGEETTAPLPPPPAATGAPRNRQRLIDLRNRVFDAAIARELDRAGDLALKPQIAKLRAIAQLVVARIAATKDLTRRLDLEDRLRGVMRQIKGDKAQLAQSLLDALSFDVDKAGATKSLGDDLRALRRLENGVKAQIAVAGHTLELSQQLLAVQQQIADVQKQIGENRAAARAARQFRALGLGPTGEELLPNADALKRHLKKVIDAVAGTNLDTSKLRAKFAAIGRILANAFGKVGPEVRKAIDDVLDSVDEQLKARSVDVTKFRQPSTLYLASRIAASLGLTPAQMRQLRGQLAALGPNGTLPQSSGQYAGAGAMGIVVQGDVHVHGVDDVKKLEQQLTKRAKQRPHVRRGAR